MQNELEQDSLQNDEKNSITNKEDISDGDEDKSDEDIPILDESNDDVSQDINRDIFWKMTTKKTNQMTLFMPMPLMWTRKK